MNARALREKEKGRRKRTHAGYFYTCAEEYAKQET